MTRRLMVYGLALSFVASALAGEVPQDFAYAVDIEGVNGPGFYAVDLNAFVYTKAARMDLGDVRVFDAQGNVLASVLRPPKTTEAAARWQALSTFALRGTPTQPVADIDVRVHGSGTSFAIQSRSARQNAVVRGYLLHNPAVKPRTARTNEPLHAVDIHWREPANFVARVSVEASDDLDRWTPVGHATLADLTQAGRRLVQRRVTLSPTRAPYLRLAWDSAEAPFVLDNARGEMRASVAPALVWYSAAVAPSAAGEYRVTLPPAVRPTQGRVEFAGGNHIAQVEWLSRGPERATWQLRGAGTVHRLQLNERELRADTIALNPTDQRQWLLRVRPSTPPPAQLAFGFAPDSLAFFAPAAGAYYVAVGNAKAAPADGRLGAVLTAHEDATALSARLGASRVLGGEARRADGAVWTRWVLWAVLGLGLLWLAWMARSALRERRAP